LQTPRTTARAKGADSGRPVRAAGSNEFARLEVSAEGIGSAMAACQRPGAVRTYATAYVSRGVFKRCVCVSRDNRKIRAVTCHATPPRSPQRRPRNNADAVKLRGCRRLRPPHPVPRLRQLLWPRVQRPARVVIEPRPHAAGGNNLRAGCEYRSPANASDDPVCVCVCTENSDSDVLMMQSATMACDTMCPVR
jgi:hypothetical protein